MSELKTLLERGVGSFEPRPGGLDRTADKRRRQRRNSRVLAGAIALAVGTLGVVVAAIGFRGTSPAPGKTNQPTIAPLPSNGVIWVRAGGGDGPSFVYEVDPSTGNVTALWHDQTGTPLPGQVNPEAIGEQYDWSPDGSRVAFSDYSGYGTDIFLLTPDGTTRTQLTHDGGMASFPAWSPDGTKIAYASDTSPPPGISAPYYEPGCEVSLSLCPSNIVVINHDGSGRTQLTHGPTLGMMPTWSPDGSKIAFVGNVGDGTQIFVMNADGGDVTQLTSGSPATEPRWSPDGTAIAFVRTEGRSAELFVMHPDGSDIRQITHLGSDTLPSFAWSPDGTEIAFDTGGDVEFGTLFLMKPDGADVRSIDVAPGYGIGDIAWRPVPRLAPSPQTGSGFTPAGPADRTYVLSGFSVTFPLIRTVGGEDQPDPSAARVDFDVAWSDNRFPGEVMCRIEARNESGSVVGSEVLSVESLPKGKRRGWVPVAVTEPPASADGTCAAGSAPAAGAGYVISNLEVVTAAGTQGAGAGPDRLIGDVAWAGGIYPGTEDCQARFLTAEAAVKALDFSLDAPEGRETLAPLTDEFAGASPIDVTCKPPGD